MQNQRTSAVLGGDVGEQQNSENLAFSLTDALGFLSKSPSKPASLNNEGFGFAPAAAGAKGGSGAAATCTDADNYEIMELQNKYNTREKELLDVLEKLVLVSYVATACICLYLRVRVRVRVLARINWRFFLTLFHSTPLNFT